MYNNLDPFFNILDKEKEDNYLDYFFNPKTIALIGASEKPKSVGKAIFENLINFPSKREIFAVNPNRKSILGYKSYKIINDIPKQIELAIIATPAFLVPKIVFQCKEAKVCSAIIISAGFKEIGEKGIKLEKEIWLNKGNMRIIGPNCLGIMKPKNGLNATFASNIALDGNIAFISQSGALGSAVLDWSLKEKIGLSAFVSVGSMIDINFADLINYFGNDPKTSSILIYMESISNPRAFLSAAKEVTLTKPIILLKAGKTTESAMAAKSHTGAIIGRDDVLNAALKRVGILRVDSIDDLFNMSEILSKQPTLKGPNLAIITNAGGPGVIATDSLILNKAKLANLQNKTFKALNKILPKVWSRNNPIDILGDASADLYYKTIKIVKKDKNVDGILVIVTPQFMTNPTKIAYKMKEFANAKIPIFGVWMGGELVEEGRKILALSNIANFQYPEIACKIFAYMWRYFDNILKIYETSKEKNSIATYSQMQKRKNFVSKIIKKARDENRVILNEFEGKKILNAFDIPVVETFVATTLKKALFFAKKIGYPVVLKLHSKSIIHKSEVNGVKLNLNSDAEVKKAFFEIRKSLKDIGKIKEFNGVNIQKMIISDGYELIIGSISDIDFGPIIVFGTGGNLVEVINDKAMELPPLRDTLARRLIKNTKIYNALKGIKNKKPIDFNKLEKILINFSNLISEFPQIKECDINPFFASENELVALDAQMVLYENSKKYSPLAIKPYPYHLIKEYKLDGASIVIRPIIAEDELQLKKFFKGISKTFLKKIYFKNYKDLRSHENLIKFCFVDYSKEITLVAQLKMASKIKGSSKMKIASKMLAIAKFKKIENTKDSFFSILVQNKYRKIGLEKLFLENIIKVTKEEKNRYLISLLYKRDVVLKKIYESFGFSIKKMKNPNFLKAVLKI